VPYFLLFYGPASMPYGAIATAQQVCGAQFLMTRICFFLLAARLIAWFCFGPEVLFTSRLRQGVSRLRVGAWRSSSGAIV